MLLHLIAGGGSGDEDEAAEEAAAAREAAAQRILDASQVQLQHDCVSWKHAAHKNS